MQLLLSQAQRPSAQSCDGAQAMQAKPLTPHAAAVAGFTHRLF